MSITCCTASAWPEPRACRHHTLSSASALESGWPLPGLCHSRSQLTLSPAQQTSIGLACGNVFATFSNNITSCNGTVTSKLLTLPQAGQGNDDHNPDRVKPRNVLDLGIGTDNLLHREGKRRYTASVEIANLAT
jgi:hypothetical protein